MLNLSIPAHIEPLRKQVLDFIENEVYPVEDNLLENKVDERRGETLSDLMQKAKDPFTIDNEIIHYLGELIVIFRY